MITAALLTLALAAAPQWTLRNDARQVTDLDRDSLRVRFVGIYNPTPQPFARTFAFAETLKANVGRELQVCVRDRATKRGALWVLLPGALVKIPTEPSDAYHLACAPFTVVRGGPVDVSNTGVLGRVDFVRHVSIRATS